MLGNNNQQLLLTLEDYKQPRALQHRIILEEVFSEELAPNKRLNVLHLQQEDFLVHLQSNQQLQEVAYLEQLQLQQHPSHKLQSACLAWEARLSMPNQEVCLVELQL